MTPYLTRPLGNIRTKSLVEQSLLAEDRVVRLDRSKRSTGSQPAAVVRARSRSTAR
jgi:hypothetical protein